MGRRLRALLSVVAMMQDALTILGGSSPFMAALVDVLAQPQSGVEPREIVLFGRNSVNLDLLAEHARRRLQPLGWMLRQTTDLPVALRGAGIVLHQIRYGGMKGRLLDERIAAAFDLPCDETLGPSALHRALCLAPDLKRVADAIATHCPRAWVVNLTNPLSITTSIIHDAGIWRCVGVCELPATTVRRAAGIVGLREEDVDWSYAGLNHRGFLVRFEHQGADLMRDLAARIGPDTLTGITGEDITSLGAIPTKYFGLLSGRYPAEPGRASFLMELQRMILAELRADPGALPPSLERRNTEWYPLSVVPMIGALSSATPGVQVVNIRADDGLVRECRAKVSRDAVVPESAVQVNGRTGQWLAIHERHEGALLEAVNRPCLSSVSAALELDPLVPRQRLKPLASAIWESYHRTVQAERLWA